MGKALKREKDGTGTTNNQPAEKAKETGVETLEKAAGTAEYGAGDVYLAPVSVIWYETDKSAVDYDPRVEREIPDTFVDGIAADGVLESITVRRVTNPANPKQTLKVVNGKTRFRAAKKAGVALLKVGLVECSDTEALRLQVLLNAHRFADESDLQCENAARLRAAGYSVKAIADTFNMKESTVVNTLKIVDRVPDVAASAALPFAAKEELSRRDPETVKEALPLLESLAKEAEASKDGKADAGLAKGKDGKPSRKADATTKKTKDGRKVGQVSHSATKALCDAIEGKDDAPAKPAKPAADKPAKAPTVAAKDTRPDAGLLRAKASRTSTVALTLKVRGESVSAETTRAFLAGAKAALFFAAGDDVNASLAIGGPITAECKEAVRAALSLMFGKDAEGALSDAA